MKKFSAIILVLLLLMQSVFANDFTDKLLLYWSFNNPATAPSFFKSSITPRGYAGSSLELNGKIFPVQLDEQLLLRKRFSVNFWFKPQNSEVQQSILTLKGDNYSDIEFGLIDQSIYCKVNGLQIDHYPFMILSNDWSMVSLSYDGQSFHLTLFSSEVTSTSHFSVSNFKMPKINAIQLSASNNGYRGLLDELMIYGKETKTTDLEALYAGTLPKEQPKALVNTPQKPAPKPVVKTTKQPNITKPIAVKKQHHFAGETVVNKHSIILEVKDWKDIRGQFDIYLNDTKIVDGETDPTGIALLNLDTDESNALTFKPRSGVMPDKKVEFKIWDGKKTIKNFDISFPSDQETIYNITHRNEKKSITEVQRSLKVTQRKLTIEVWDDKIADGDFISILHNGIKVLDYQEITKEKIRVEISIKKDVANLIAFVSEDSGSVGNNSAKVRIYENGVVVDEFRFTSTYRKIAGLLIQLQENQKQKNK